MIILETDKEFFMDMKELDLNQLEGISGGGFADCTPFQTIC